MKKMSLPHTQKWPQGGAQRLIGRDLLQLDAPPSTRGRSQGHAPSPQLPKRGRIQRQETGVGLGGPRRNQFFTFLQSQRKSARNLDRCLSRCPGQRKGFVEGRNTLPLPRASLLRGGPHVKFHPKVPVTIPGEEGRGPRREGPCLLSAPPAGRPSPGRGRGLCPARGTRQASGHGTPPPHPPCRGHVGARPEAPPALLHVGVGSRPSARRGASGPRKLGNPHFKRYPRIRSTRRPPRYGRGPSTPIRRFRAPSPRRRRKTLTSKPPPAPGGAPGAHLHDAVRGLGCRHLHPRLLLLRPPRPPPFSALPRDRLILEGPRPAHRDPARRSHWQRR